MFKNIGGKIKVFAIIVFIIWILIGIGCCIAFIALSNEWFDDASAGTVNWCAFTVIEYSFRIFVCYVYIRLRRAY